MTHCAGTPPPRPAVRIFNPLAAAAAARHAVAGELRLPKLLSDPAKDFVNRALARNRLERLRVEEMLEHPWIKSAAVRASRSGVRLGARTHRHTNHCSVCPLTKCSPSWVRGHRPGAARLDG
jgi:hypothetical protein